MFSTVHVHVICLTLVIEIQRKHVSTFEIQIALVEGFITLFFLFQACLVLLVVALTTGVFGFPTKHGTDGEIREPNEGHLRMRRDTNIKTRKYIHCLTFFR